MKIEIIDLGINNLTSVVKAFSGKNEEVEVRKSDEDRATPKLIVLPGLGKFASGMEALQRRKLVSYIQQRAKSGVPIVGICLGMQLLGDSSDESTGAMGLGLIAGESRKLIPAHGERVPHVSWASTRLLKDHLLFPSLESKKDFYFVHSYVFEPLNRNVILSQTEFGLTKFTSSVRQENVVGFQFHPEKSGNIGKQLVSEVLSWVSDET